MGTVAWVLQWVLAAVFVGAGAMKAFAPEPRLLEDPRMGWIHDEGIGRARLAGRAELLGALGLVLPGLVGVATFLTPLAALGLVVVMALATRLHVDRGETSMVPVTVLLGTLALVVAVIRTFVEPL